MKSRYRVNAPMIVPLRTTVALSLIHISPLLEKVEGFRRAALASLDQDRLEGNPKEWFSAATAYIDALHTVELDIRDRLGALARQLRAESVRAFYVSIGIAGGVVVLMRCVSETGSTSLASFTSYSSGYLSRLGSVRSPV